MRKAVLSARRPPHWMVPESPAAGASRGVALPFAALMALLFATAGCGSNSASSAQPEGPGGETGGSGAAGGASGGTEFGAASGGMGQCPGGQTRCGAECASLLSDPAHCGACDVACSASQTCEDAQCVCPVGLLLCAGGCVDPRSDGSHCGACANGCPEGRFCSAGTCVASCTVAGQTECGNSCVDLQTNPLHCGSCELACPAGQGCVGGVCACASAQTLCAGVCVDISEDSGHCGGCGVVCSGGQSCENGSCVCPTDEQWCGSLCTNTSTDASNCGSCGTVCAGDQTCDSGGCVDGTAGAGGAGAGGEPGTATGGDATGGVSTGGVNTGGDVSGGTAAGGDLTGGTGGSVALGYPDPSSVVDAMVLANEWFMSRHPDPGALAPGNRTSNLWTRAVYYEGLMALHEVAPSSRYYDYAVEWGSDNNWSLRAVGASDNADPQCAGQTYIDLYNLEGGNNPAWIAAITSSIDAMVASSNVGSWTWIDAMQMSMPVFARLGVLKGDTSYFDKMWALYSHTRNTEGGGLFNEAVGLWWRDADYSPGGTYTLSPNGEDIYWSRGNGWVIAALARTLELLPSGDAHRAQYQADLQAMAAALAQVQRDDGFWNTSLHDPTHCAAKGLPEEDGPETSGTALFVYGIGWGIRNGLLEDGVYGPVVLDAWEGLANTALHTDGMVGYIQSTGAEPCDPDGERGLGLDWIPNFDDFGVGCFLLAGSEIFKLAQR